MAITKEHVQLKLMVDKRRNRVIFAEADADFVDCLFSFLTFPLGTIARLIGNKAQSQPITVGCFKTLYESVMNLDDEHFCREECKDMLLKPRSSLEKERRKLKINVDDSEPTKYFTCHYFSECHKKFPELVSIYNTTSCICCGNLMTREILFEDSNSSSRDKKLKDEGFVIQPSKFIITDDLQVMPPGKVIELLKSLRIQDTNVIEERILRLGLNQFLKLLKWMFLSTTPLTDLFVLKRKFPARYKDLPLQKRCSFEQDQGVRKMKVKVMMKKSNKEVLFLEAQHDFIDFLFSLLTIPLGQMLHILDGHSSLRSIDSLYKSLQALDSQYFFSENHKNILLRPKLPHYFTCKNQLLPVETIDVSFSVGSDRRIVHDLPKNGSIITIKEVGDFVRGHVVFMVMDNLVVIPYSPGSVISVMNRNKCSLSDLEERTISFGLLEGLSILRASLNSASALTNGLFHKLNSKDTKQETL